MRTTPPELVPADAVAFAWECDRCAWEKTAGVNGRAWGWGERRDSVRNVAELPAGVEETWVECPYGHRAHVVRDGTRVARAFGLARAWGRRPRGSPPGPPEPLLRQSL